MYRLLNEDGTIASGKQIEDMLLALLETLYQDKMSEKKSTHAAATAELAENGDSDNDAAGTGGDPPMPDSFMPVDMLLFAYHGPPSGNPIDDFALEISDGPKKKKKRKEDHNSASGGDDNDSVGEFQGRSADADVVNGSLNRQALRELGRGNRKSSSSSSSISSSSSSSSSSSKRVANSSHIATAAAMKESSAEMSARIDLMTAAMREAATARTAAAAATAANAARTQRITELRVKIDILSGDARQQAVDELVKFIDSGANAAAAAPAFVEPRLLPGFTTPGSAPATSSAGSNTNSSGSTSSGVVHTTAQVAEV
jgi:hypothetical protein